MSVMTVEDFTVNCEEVIDQVDATCEPVFITRDGVPIASLYAFGRKPKGLIGVMKGLFIEENIKLLEEPVLKPEDLIDPSREPQS